MCNITPFTVEKISPRVRIKLGPLDQKASALPTELPGLLSVRRKQVTCNPKLNYIHFSAIELGDLCGFS